MKKHDWLNCGFTVLLVAIMPLWVQPSHWGVALACGVSLAVAVGFALASMRIQGRSEAHREHLATLDRLETDIRSLEPPCTRCRRPLYMHRPPEGLQ